MAKPSRSTSILLRLVFQTQPRSSKTMHTITTESEETRYAELQRLALDFARHGETGPLAEMLRHGLPVNLADHKGQTLLMLASYHGHLDTTHLLLEHGADPNQPEDSAPAGLALFTACAGNHLETAELLLAHGANPNAGSDSNGCCLTICEVYHGDRAKPMQELLRRHGAYNPPYAMSVGELKQAIRDDHKTVHHEEFADCVIRVIVKAQSPPVRGSRETGRAFLLSDQAETTGYGLYSYLLLGSRPTAATRERHLKSIAEYL